MGMFLRDYLHTNKKQMVEVLNEKFETKSFTDKEKRICDKKIRCIEGLARTAYTINLRGSKPRIIEMIQEWVLEEVNQRDALCSAGIDFKNQFRQVHS